MMPFSLIELVSLSRCMRDAGLGIIKLAYPETKSEHREEYLAAFRSVGVTTNAAVQQRIQAQQKRWVQLFKVSTEDGTQMPCVLCVVILCSSVHRVDSESVKFKR